MKPNDKMNSGDKWFTIYKAKRPIMRVTQWEEVSCHFSLDAAQIALADYPMDGIYRIVESKVLI